MPWYIPWSESIKKRACRYLLQHYLGQFLQEKLTLDQLSIDLFNGTGSICDLNLDVESLNKCLESVNVPIEIVDGFVRGITAAIPWSTLTSDNTVMEISGLELTLQPRESLNEEGISMLNSMFSSMTTSLQLAQECLRQDEAEGSPASDTAQPLEGLEMFAQTIESVLSRIKVTLVDTVIRLEHSLEQQNHGVALEVRIKRIEYFDDQATNDGVNIAHSGNRNVYEPAAICYKNFYLMGVSFFADKFPMTQRSYYKESMMLSARSATTSMSDTGEKRSAHNAMDSELIKIAVLTGRQEMKVKVKQCDAIPGPKLEVHLHIGSIHSILSPKYVHVLVDLFEGFQVTNENSNNLFGAKTTNKAMGSLDFLRVEDELQRQLREGHRAQIMTNMLHNDEFDDTALDESFLAEGLYYSLDQSQLAGFSDMTSSACSSVSSKTSTTNTSIIYNYGTGYQQRSGSPFAAQARKRSREKCNVQKLLDDPGAEVTRYKFKISFFSLMLLHEDPPDTPSDGIEPALPGYDKMRTLVEAFFTKVSNIPLHGVDTALSDLRKRFALACPHDHIVLLSKPITLECDCKTVGTKKSTISADLSVGVMEVVETVYERCGFNRRKTPFAEQKYEHNELLIFQTPSQEYASIQTTPCLKLKVVDYQTTGRGLPTTDVTVNLAPVISEIDVTLMDRIHSLLTPPSGLCASTDASRYYQGKRSAESTCNSDKNINLHVSSSSVTLLVRFPVPDLRPGNAVDKFPWWKRTLHNETLIVELTDFNFRTSSLPDSDSLMLDFRATDVNALFKESADHEAVSFLRAGYGGHEGDEIPRLVVKIYPTADRCLNEEQPESDTTPPHELDDACHFEIEKEPSPFSTKKVLHDNEQKVIPGERAEMDSFKERSSSNTRILLDITIPNINIILPSKEFYELVYNRINGDLLLWIPQAPSPLTIHQHNLCMIHPRGLDYANQLIYSNEEYLPCKSAIRYDSSSDSEDSLGPQHAIYAKDDILRRSREDKSNYSAQNRLCLNLNVGFGKITLCTPVKESGEDSKCEQGRLLLEVEDGNFFLVNGCNKVQSIAITANRGAVFHNGSLPFVDSWPELGRATVEPTDLEATIYKSDSGVPSNIGTVGTGPDSLDMISIAIRVTPEQLSANASSKEFLVAFALRGSTLRHRMSLSRHSWFTQVIDFLDVRDFPVRGYTLPKIVTVLHCHIWSCAIDYRPLNIPYRCLVVMENFSISSNIIAKSNTTLLKFIIEDATLSLSQNCKANSVSLMRDYICVLEVGLFELTLLTSDGKDWKYPRTDLKASNNMIHVRTCSDSCVALRQLILYLTNYGDLIEESDSADITPRATPNPEMGPIVAVPESRLEEVHDMMADAMQEEKSEASLEDERGTPESIRRRDSISTEVFFFPDEHQANVGDSVNEVASIPVNETGFDCEHDNVESSGEEVYSDDEEFCIIDDPGLGISPRDGEPTVRCLTAESLLVKENHFSIPYGNIDVLKAPDSFPNAVCRYTLKEMSVVWHMYGGEDFREGTAAKVTVVGSRVAYGKPHVEKSKLPWRVRGGPFRDHATLMQLYMNKIRLQHEVYPDSTPQASRQIFIVHELEVRDKLASSQINKFLYQYSSDLMPRQTNAKMVLVKNVHLRPDVNVPATQECSLKISILPLRLNIDQDSLMFLRKFLTEITNDDDEAGPTRLDTTGADIAGTPPKSVSVPVMGSPSDFERRPTDRVKFDELSDSQRSGTPEPPPDHNPIFFKTFVFSPDVLIRLDYHGKRVTMGHQSTATGLLAGLAQLNCSEFRLKRINYRHGLLGVDRLFLYAANEWLTDMKKNQLPSILGGVGPMHTVVQLFQGVKDLFWLPVEQYRKDGRIFRGIQRGANSFTTSTLMAALELTNRTVQSIQYVAELTYDMVSPGQAIRVQRRKRATQPSDFREGVNTAYLVLRDGITDTAGTIIRAAQKEHDMKGMTGAVGGVLRQIPPTVIQPFILATEATSNVLGGMRNQLLPDAKREEAEKWKIEDH